MADVTDTFRITRATVNQAFVRKDSIIIGVPLKITIHVLNLQLQTLLTIVNKTRNCYGNFLPRFSIVQK